MVSIGNKATLVSSEYCMKCAKCCKEFNMSTDINIGLRIAWMPDFNFKVEDTPFILPFGAGNEIKICFKTSCSKLQKVGNKYTCSVWNKDRPDFCNTYPDHIFYDVETWNTQKIEKLLKFESENCPALKDITVEQVQDMLKKRSGEE
jgi:hypothetical protein